MKLEMPKVSVIVPVYKVEKYIEESIRSICEQEYRNIEIIIINDGTPDSSIELAQKVASSYSKTLTIVNKQNGGLPSARNVGIKVATGDYLCFIDSDDMISTRHISDLVNVCEKYKTKVAYADFQLTHETNRYGENITHNVTSCIKHNILLRGFLVRKFKIHCCALIIDRKYLISNDLLFDEKLRYGEDIDFMWRLFPTLDSIAYTGNNTYLYLQRSGSLMTSQNMERVITLLDNFKITVDQLLSNYPDDRQVLKYLYGKAALAFYRTFAETSSYELFEELLIKTNYKRNVWKVVFIGNIKLSLLTISLLVSPRLFADVVKQMKTR
ncbi:glycosyltransferase family 2 protein [Jutongia sp.]